MNAESIEMKTLGVVLSGGGIRGVAHVGVLQVLREAGLPIAHLAGTSAGALVGVMAAAGCSVNDMLDFWLESNPFTRRNMAGFRTPGLFSTTRYCELLRGFVQRDRFDELQTPLSVAVTAMLAGRVEYVSQGPLWPIVVASAAFPMVFSPVRHEGEVFMDGGIIDNLPVAAIRDRCDVVLGVNVSPHRHVSSDTLRNQVGILDRVFDLTLRSRADASERECDVVVVPEGLGSTSTFDTRQGLAIYEAGVEAGRAVLPQLREALEA